MIPVEYSTHGYTYLQVNHQQNINPLEISKYIEPIIMEGKFFLISKRTENM